MMKRSTKEEFLNEVRSQVEGGYVPSVIVFRDRTGKIEMRTLDILGTPRVVFRATVIGSADAPEPTDFDTLEGAADFLLG